MTTLKVVAKRIPPGDVHLAASFEHRGDMAMKARGLPENLVYVGGFRNALVAFLQNAVPYAFRDPDNMYCWAFAQRPDADRFARSVFRYDGLAFWQLGPSPVASSATTVPTLASFVGSGERLAHLPAQRSFTEEQFRAQAEILLGALGTGYTMAFIDDTSAMSGTPVKFPPARTFTSASSVIPNRDTRLSGRVLFHLVIFDDPIQARLFFCEAAANNVGCGWQFGYIPNPGA